MIPILRLIGKNLSWLVLGNALSRGAVLLVVAIVALTMGPAQVGVLTIALGAAMVAIPLFALGQVEVIIRESAKEPERIPAFSRAGKRDRLRALALGVPVALAGLFLVDDADLRTTLLAALPFVLLRVEASIRVAHFTGLDRMEVGTQTRGIEAVTTLAFVAAAGWAGLPVWSVALALGLGAGISLLWVLGKAEELPGETATEPISSLLPESIHFLGQGVVLQLLLRSDAFLLAAFAVSKEEIGFYGAAAAVVWGLLAPAQLVATALYPTLSRRARGGRQPARSAWLTAGVGWALGAGCALGVWLFRHPLVDLVFGDEFVATIPILGHLLWALPPAAGSMVVGITVAAWGRQHLGLVVLFSAFVLFVSLAFAWIPERDVFGAADAAVVAQWAAFCGMFAVAVWPGREKSFGEPEAAESGS